MSSVKIAVINASKTLQDAEVRPVVPMLQQQVKEHFLPAWGIDAELTFFSKTGDPPVDSWWLTIVDDPDVAQMNGYHDVTPTGMPLAKVFAALVQQAGGNWTVTASHEILEMLADPDDSLMVVDPRLSPHSLPKPGAKTGTFYFYEVCDPCSSEKYAYKMDGTEVRVWVSDFVFPAWFESFRQPGSTKFDYGGYIDAPLKLVPGGYIGVFDAVHGWSLKDGGDLPKFLQESPVGSRMERRIRPRSQWKPSLPAARRPQSEDQERMERLIHHVRQNNSHLQIVAGHLQKTVEHLEKISSSANTTSSRNKPS